MLWLWAGLVTLGALVGTLYWIAYGDHRKLGRALAALVIVLLAIVTIALLATGRLAAALPVLASAIVALWRMKSLARIFANQASWLGRGGGASRGGTGRRSRVRTAWLEMGLDHDSGALDGEILDGPFRGRRLSDLEFEDAVSLLRDLERHDPEGVRLLEAFLDRAHGADWRERADYREQADRESHAAAAARAGMSEAEARAVLGVAPDADAAAIKAAHRALMKKLHPDHGGTGYFAAKLNEAKDVLLSRR